jgi:hypothetical protein
MSQNTVLASDGHLIDCATIRPSGFGPSQRRRPRLEAFPMYGVYRISDLAEAVLLTRL